MNKGFDRLAGPYRWMEYMAFGRALERCRFLLLPHLAATRSALLLGDGDGRFAARLLRAAPQAHITAVDASAAMLGALGARCAQTNRLSTQCLDLATDSLSALPGQPFDLVASHFFLDCLDDAQVEHLVQQVKPLLANNAQWIVSEFHIPQSVLRLPAHMLVRSLYAAFRVLAGLRVQRLPEHRRILQANGFTCTTRVYLLAGLLVSEQWRWLNAD